MVSAGLPPAVVKSLEETEAAQSAPKPRPSVTSMVPKPAWMVAPGDPLPRNALSGAVIVSGALVTPVVTGHLALLVPGGHVLPGSAEVAVLTRRAPPVSGLLTMTE